MNIELSNLLKRLADRQPSCVQIYASDGNGIISTELNEGYGFKALKQAVESVEVSEIFVYNTQGTNIAWHLVSSGGEGIIDQCGETL